MGSGTVGSSFKGTISEVANLAKGTITAVTSITNLAKGTITKVEGGTIISDNFTFRHGDAFATVISSTGTATGTIKPAVAGSAIYVTDLIISVGTASDVIICNGVTTKPLLGTLHFYDDGGLVSNFISPLQTSSGSALIYKQTAAVPLTITCLGYID